MKYRPTLFALAVLVCIMPGRVLAAPEGCTGSFSDLMPYAGTYRIAAVLDEPRVAAALKQLLGSELAHLKRNLDVVGPIDLISCDLVIAGNAPHQGTVENAIVTIDVYSGAVAAGILSDRRIAIYVGRGKRSASMAYDAVPLAIKDWAALAATGFRSRIVPPPNAELLPPQGAWK